MTDPPVEVAIGVAREMPGGQVHRAGITVRRHWSISPPTGAVAKGAVLSKDLLADCQRRGIVRQRIGTIGRRRAIRREIASHDHPGDERPDPPASEGNQVTLRQGCTEPRERRERNERHADQRQQQSVVRIRKKPWPEEPRLGRCR